MAGIFLILYAVTASAVPVSAQGGISDNQRKASASLITWDAYQGLDETELSSGVWQFCGRAELGARCLNSALALWTAPDPMARDFSNINPYVYCASNPIKYIDPTGCANIVFEGKIIGNDGINDNIMLVIPEYKKKYEDDGDLYY